MQNPKIAGLTPFHAKGKRALLLLTLVCGLVSSAISQSESTNSAQKREAEKALDALIKAKGGRERLESVSSMLVRFGDLTRLEVLPDSSWEYAHWIDGRPALSVHVEKEKLAIVAGPNGVEINTHESCGNGGCWLDQIPYLLETKWYKPVPLRVTREKNDRKIADVLEVGIGDQRLGFVYEPEDMLVKEVRFISDGKVWQKYRLDKYVDVDGIKMPTLWSIGDIGDRFVNLDHLIPISFRFNVDYDPKIFAPPFTATTPDAWKRKN